MNRAILGAAGVMASLGIAACGSAAATGGTTPSASPSTGGRGAFTRNAAFGQLVQIRATTLILSSSTGDATVTYAPTTTITQTSTGTLGEHHCGHVHHRYRNQGRDRDADRDQRHPQRSR